VRFLEVGAGGFLGIGKKRFLVPVEAVVEVAAGLVAIEPERTQKVEVPAPFDTKVAPPADAYSLTLRIIQGVQLDHYEQGSPRTLLRLSVEFI
jgi:hypothetical protein